VPAVQENTAGGDQGPAPPDGGWADRIRVPCLLLHDERDLAGETANRSLTLWPSSFVRPTSAPDRGEPVVPSGVVYEARLDPSVMRERPWNHWLQQTLAKLGGERGCRAPDVQGARISSSRGRLPPARRAVQHRDRARTLGQDGCGVAEDGSGRRDLASIGCGTMIGIQRGKYLGKPLGDPPKDDAEHFVRCPACSGWIDCRDLAQVFEHNQSLPHPAQDQPQ
jgi:hypothetical protein